jgi:hypothetical protein
MEDGKTWRDAAREFPHRTEDSVRFRWLSIKGKLGLSTAGEKHHWTSEDDVVLRETRDSGGSSREGFAKLNGPSLIAVKTRWETLGKADGLSRGTSAMWTTDQDAALRDAIVKG